MLGEPFNKMNDMKKRYIICNLRKDKYYYYGEMKIRIENAQQFKSKKDAKICMGSDFWSDNNGDYFEIRTIYTND